MSSSYNGEKYLLPEFKVKFNPIPMTRLKSFNKMFNGYEHGLVRSDTGGFVMPADYALHAENVYRFQPRKDDVWVVTYPKCGTTWTQELVWLVVNNCDFETAKKIPLGGRSPFLEMTGFMPEKIRADPALKPHLITPEKIDKMPSPRIIKSHLTFDLIHPKLLDTCKVVYVARNPKDTIVSFYYHHRLFALHGYQGDLEQFAEFFMNDQVMCCPFFDHIIAAWNKRHHPNLHFMFYEDMKKDLRGEIAKVATFLGKSLTDEQLDMMTEHLRFSSIEKNIAVNNEAGRQSGFMRDDGKFMRNGKTGDWKNHFSAELNERIDRWTESKLSGTDLKFINELENQVN